MRWVYDRSVETIDATDAQLSTAAELVEPGLSAAGLLERIAAARARIRSTYEAVVRAGTIRALTG